MTMRRTVHAPQALLKRLHFMQRHSCNAYCAGERHAQVLYLMVPAGTDTAAEIGATLAAMGLRVLSVEPAHEAPSLRGRQGTVFPAESAVRSGQLTDALCEGAFDADLPAFLVTFDIPDTVQP